jgi:hypothetical protein
LSYFEFGVYPGIINMTQSNFDYITINSDSDSNDEEENKFKDKFSVVVASNMLDCNICYKHFIDHLCFSNVIYVFFKYVQCVLIHFILYIIIIIVHYVKPELIIISKYI